MTESNEGSNKRKRTEDESGDNKERFVLVTTINYDEPDDSGSVLVPLTSPMTELFASGRRYAEYDSQEGQFNEVDGAKEIKVTRKLRDDILTFIIDKRIELNSIAGTLSFEAVLNVRYVWG